MPLVNYSQDFANAMNSLGENFSFDENGNYLNADQFNWSDIDPNNAGQRAFEEQNQMQEEAKNPENMTYEEKKALAEEQTKAGQTKELSGDQAVAARLSDFAKNINGLWGFEDSWGKFTDELSKGNFDLGSGLKAGLGFVGQMATLPWTIPMDVSAQIEESTSGTPVTESHIGEDGKVYAADYMLSDEQRQAASIEATANALLGTVGGIGAGVRGIGKLANALARGEKAADSLVFKAGKNAVAKAAEDKFGKFGRFAGNVALSGAEGYGLGAAGAVRGTQEEHGLTDEEGNIRWDAINQSGLGSAAMMAAGGALGHAKSLFGEQVSTDIVNEERRLGLTPGEYSESQRSKDTRDKTVGDVAKMQQDIQDGYITNAAQEELKEDQKQSNNVINATQEVLTGSDEARSSWDRPNEETALHEFNADMDFIDAAEKEINKGADGDTQRTGVDNINELNTIKQQVAEAWGFQTWGDVVKFEKEYNNGTRELDARAELRRIYNESRKNGNVRLTWKIKEPVSGKQGTTAVDQIVEGSGVEARHPSSATTEAKADNDSDKIMTGTYIPQVAEKQGRKVYHNLEMFDPHRVANEAEARPDLSAYRLDKNKFTLETFEKHLTNIELKLNQNGRSLLDYVPDRIRNNKEIKTIKELANYFMNSTEDQYNKDFGETIFRIFKERKLNYIKGRNSEAVANHKADFDLFGDNNPDSNNTYGLFYDMTSHVQTDVDITRNFLKNEYDPNRKIDQDILDDTSVKEDLPKKDIYQQTNEGLHTDTGRAIASEVALFDQLQGKDVDPNAVRESTQPYFWLHSALKGRHSAATDGLLTKTHRALMSVFRMATGGEKELTQIKGIRDNNFLLDFWASRKNTETRNPFEQKENGDIVVKLENITKDDIDLMKAILADQDNKIIRAFENDKSSIPAKVKLLLRNQELSTSKIRTSKDISDEAVVKALGSLCTSDSLNIKMELKSGKNEPDLMTIQDISTILSNGTPNEKADIRRRLPFLGDNEVAKKFRDNLLGINERIKEANAKSINSGTLEFVKFIIDNFASVRAGKWNLNNFKAEAKDLLKILNGLEINNDKIGRDRRVIGLHSAFSDKLYGVFFKYIAKPNKEFNLNDITNAIHTMNLIENNRKTFNTVADYIAQANELIGKDNNRAANYLFEAKRWLMNTEATAFRNDNSLYQRTAVNLLAELDNVIMFKETEKSATWQENAQKNLSVVQTRLNKILSTDVAFGNKVFYERIMDMIKSPYAGKLKASVKQEIFDEKTIQDKFLVDAYNGPEKATNELGYKMRRANMAQYVGETSFQAKNIKVSQDKAGSVIDKLKKGENVDLLMQRLQNRAKNHRVKISKDQLVTLMRDSLYADLRAKDKGTTPIIDVVRDSILRLYYGQSGVDNTNPLSLYGIKLFGVYSEQELIDNPQVIVEAFSRTPEDNFSINVLREENGVQKIVSYTREDILTDLGIKLDSNGNVDPQSFAEFLETDTGGIFIDRAFYDDVVSLPSMNKKEKVKTVSEDKPLEQLLKEEADPRLADEETLDNDIVFRLANSGILPRIANAILDEAQLAKNEKFELQNFFKKFSTNLDYFTQLMKCDDVEFQKAADKLREDQRNFIDKRLEYIDENDFLNFENDAETPDKTFHNEVSSILYKTPQEKEAQFKNSMDVYNKNVETLNDPANPGYKEAQQNVMMAFMQDFIGLVSDGNNIIKDQKNPDIAKSVKRVEIAAQKIMADSVNNIKLLQASREYLQKILPNKGDQKSPYDITLLDIIGLPDELAELLLTNDTPETRSLSSMLHKSFNEISTISDLVLLPNEEISVTEEASPIKILDFMKGTGRTRVQKFNQFLRNASDYYTSKLENQYVFGSKKNDWGIINEDIYNDWLELYISATRDNNTDALDKLATDMSHKLLDAYNRNKARLHGHQDITISNAEAINDVLGQIKQLRHEIYQDENYRKTLQRTRKQETKIPESPDLSGFIVDSLNAAGKLKAETAGAGGTGRNVAGVGSISEKLVPFELISKVVDPLRTETIQFDPKADPETKAFSFIEQVINNVYDQVDPDSEKFTQIESTDISIAEAIQAFATGDYEKLNDIDISSAVNIKVTPKLKKILKGTNIGNDWWSPDMSDIIKIVQAINNNTLDSITIGKKSNPNIALLSRFVDIGKEGRSLTVRKDAPEIGTKILEELAHYRVDLSREQITSQDPIEIINAVKEQRLTLLKDFAENLISESFAKKLDKKAFLQRREMEDGRISFDPAELEMLFPYVDIQYTDGSKYRWMIRDFYEGVPDVIKPGKTIKSINIDVIDPVVMCKAIIRKSISAKSNRVAAAKSVYEVKPGTLIQSNIDDKPSFKTLFDQVECKATKNANMQSSFNSGEPFQVSIDDFNIAYRDLEEDSYQKLLTFEDRKDIPHFDSATQENINRKKQQQKLLDIVNDGIKNQTGSKDIRYQIPIMGTVLDLRRRNKNLVSITDNEVLSDYLNNDWIRSLDNLDGNKAEYESGIIVRTNNEDAKISLSHTISIKLLNRSEQYQSPIIFENLKAANQFSEILPEYRRFGSMHQNNWNEIPNIGPNGESIYVYDPRIKLTYREKIDMPKTLNYGDKLAKNNLVRKLVLVDKQNGISSNVDDASTKVLLYAQNILPKTIDFSFTLPKKIDPRSIIDEPRFVDLNQINIKADKNHRDILFPDEFTDSDKRKFKNLMSLKVKASSLTPVKETILGAFEFKCDDGNTYYVPIKWNADDVHATDNSFDINNFKYKDGLIRYVKQHLVGNSFVKGEDMYSSNKSGFDYVNYRLVDKDGIQFEHQDNLVSFGKKVEEVGGDTDWNGSLVYEIGFNSKVDFSLLEIIRDGLQKIINNKLEIENFNAEEALKEIKSILKLDADVLAEYNANDKVSKFFTRLMSTTFSKDKKNNLLSQCWEYYLRDELGIKDENDIKNSCIYLNDFINKLRTINLSPTQFLESETFKNKHINGIRLNSPNAVSQLGQAIGSRQAVCSIYGPLTKNTMVDFKESTSDWRLQSVRQRSKAKIKDGYMKADKIEEGNLVATGFGKVMYGSAITTDPESSAMLPKGNSAISDAAFTKSISFSRNVEEAWDNYLTRTVTLDNLSEADAQRLYDIIEIKERNAKDNSQITSFNQDRYNSILAESKLEFFDPKFNKHFDNTYRIINNLDFEIFDGAKDSDQEITTRLNIYDSNNYIKQGFDILLDAFKQQAKKSSSWDNGYDYHDYQFVLEWFMDTFNIGIEIQKETGEPHLKIPKQLFDLAVEEGKKLIEENKWSVTEEDFKDTQNWFTIDQYGSNLYRIKIPITRQGWYEYAANKGLFTSLKAAENYRKNICDMLGDYSKHLNNTDNLGTTDKSVLKAVENNLAMSKRWAGYDDFAIVQLKRQFENELKISFDNIRDAQDDNISPEAREAKEEVLQKGWKRIQDTLKRANQKDHEWVEDISDPAGNAMVKRRNTNEGLNKALNKGADISQAMGLLDVKVTAQNVIAKEIGYFFQDLFHRISDAGVGIFSSPRERLKLSDDPIANRVMIEELAGDPTISKIVDLFETISHKGQAEDYIWRRLQSGKISREELDNLANEGRDVIDKIRDFSARIGTGRDIGRLRRNRVFINNWLKMASEDDYLYQELSEPVTVDVNGQKVTVTKLEFLGMNTSPEEKVNILTNLILNSPGQVNYAELTRKAYNQTMMGDMAHESVPSTFMEALIQKNGLTRALSCILGTRYIRASNNILGRSLNSFLPMSSFNYELSQWIKRKADDPNFFKKLQSIEFLRDKWATPEQLKSDMEAVKGYNRLREALFFDACHMGAGMLLAVLLSNAEFLQPPDDKDKMFNYKEWTIGGLRVNHNWWLDDIFGVVLPIACWARSAELGQPNFNILINGLQEHVATNPFIKISDVVDLLGNNEPETNEVEEICSRYEKSPEGAPDGIEYALATAPAMGMSMFGNLLTPTFLKDWTKLINQNEKSYNRDNEGNRLTFKEAQIKKVTRNNPVLGAIMDIVSGGGNYQSWEMPDQLYSDPIQMAFMKKYSVLDENKEYKPKAERDRIVMELIVMLSLTDDTKELRKNGWCLDQETKNLVAKELSNCYYATKEDFENLRMNGFLDPSTLGNGNYQEGLKQYNKILREYKQQLSYWQSLYRDKLYSKDLNVEMQKYTRYNTTYAKDMNGNWYATGMEEGLGGFISPLLYAPNDPSKVDPDSDWASRSQLNSSAMYDANGNAMRGMVAQPVSYQNIPSMASWVNEKLNLTPLSSSSRRSGSGGSGGGKSIHSNLPNFDVGKAASGYGSVNRDRTYYDDYRPNVEVANTRNARSYNKI